MSAPDATSNDESADSNFRIRGLLTNSVFIGILLTQFLGAFNDNYFKQMVLLKCSELERLSNIDMQTWAMGAFALPFVLLSGLGGYISDRCSRRTVIVWCKVGEIVVMSCSLLVLLIWAVAGVTQLTMLIIVLALMGGQSALFGPSKYGILPELFTHRELMPVNGAIQMTTFMAIIFGTAGAGMALDLLSNSMWFSSLIAVAIAVVGTGTSLMICRTPPNHPQLKLRPENLALPKDSRRLLRELPGLRNAILVATAFWFIGGVTQPSVNTLGEHVFHMNKTRTSLLAAAIGVGIAIGCAVSGVLSRHRDSGAKWVRLGAWMIIVSLVIITVLSSGIAGMPVPDKDAAPGIVASVLSANRAEWCLRGAMILLGFAAGVFVVPVQVYIQESPPPELKGRMLGAQNLLTWVGILVSAGFLGLVNVLIGWCSADGQGYHNRYLIFAVLAVLMLPVAMFYRLDVVPSENGDMRTEEGG